MKKKDSRHYFARLYTFFLFFNYLFYSFLFGLNQSVLINILKEMINLTYQVTFLHPNLQSLINALNHMIFTCGYR